MKQGVWFMGSNRLSPADEICPVFDRIVLDLEVRVPGLQLAIMADDGSVTDGLLLTALSEAERQHAIGLPDETEYRHFIFRRGFQRFVVARSVRWTQPLSEISLRHARDQRPQCQDAPQFCLSFSSSGSTFAACLCEGGDVGVDIEKSRPVADVVALAHRFFTAPEAAFLADCPASLRNEAFLTMWSAKEAGLKALGCGIDFGLNTFTLRFEAGLWQPTDQRTPASHRKWHLLLPKTVPEHTVAVMHSSVE
jgi:phosphopantetheinyl transferase